MILVKKLTGDVKDKIGEMKELFGINFTKSEANFCVS